MRARRLGPRHGAQAARPRARLLVRAGALDAPAAARRSRSSPGRRVLDVGSNTCWAANHFAERGLRAIALDIATVELQGLYTADWFIEDGQVFFERVLGSMDAIPLASSSVDYVYCCEVLHHNDRDGLRRTFAEIFRVLRPGGRLLMVNETLKTLRDPARRARRGRRAVRGLRARPLGLPLPLGGDARRLLHRGHRAALPAVLRRRRASRGRTRRIAPAALRAPARRSRCGAIALARRVLPGLARTTCWGGVSMNMIATKPRRYVGPPRGHGRRRARCARAPAAGAAPRRSTVAAESSRRACRARPSRRPRRCGRWRPARGSRRRAAPSG